MVYESVIDNNKADYPDYYSSAIASVGISFIYSFLSAWQRRGVCACVFWGWGGALLVFVKVN